VSPTPPALPAGTTLGKSYEYGLDVNLGTLASKVWQSCRRISNFQPTPTPNNQNAQTYDDFGAQNSDVAGWSWTLAFQIQVNRSLATGLYLAEVEALLARTRPSAKGEAAVIEVRWYHKPEVGTPNPSDAGQGLATVAPARANIGPDGTVEALNFTLTGKGPYTEIANPFAGWDASAPVIQGVTPSGAGEGELVTLTGVGFVGATEVTVGGTAVVDFEVLGDATIVAILPVGAAGDVPVVVTNAVGPSAAYTYTRGV
jgi:hypothetical protein